MHRVHRKTTYYLSIIPLVTLVWSLILQHISGPFYISRTDPEYVYLLNGLNVALLEFDRIGHVDHPGTPFQLLTGLFIRIVYWISGEGSVLKDVITYPEKYLAWSSFFLTVLTSWLLFRNSILVFKNTGKRTGALILPFAVFFMYMVLIDIPSRYIPDRFQMILLVLFSNVYIRYFYNRLSEKHFAIRSGIIMGLGLTAKINFLPFVFLPLFLIKKIRRSILYSISLVISIVFMLAPIHDKFNQFWHFAVGIFKHDRLYGSGETQVIDPSVFFNNIILVFSENLPFMFFLGMALVLVVWMLLRKEKRSGNHAAFRLFSGLGIVSLIGILMVAKHYKNYYMIPVLTASGLGYFMLWSYFSSKSRGKRIVPIVTPVLGLFFFIWILKPLTAMYSQRIEFRHEEMAVKKVLDELVSHQNYLLVEPTWMAGPMQENGLVYGNSYIGHRFNFYNDYEKVYPNVLTYEGRDKPLWYLRLLPADNEAIMKSGRPIYLLSTPGRNAEGILDYLGSEARRLNLNLEFTNVYSNDSFGRKIYRIKNTDGWRTVSEVSCGFEQVKGVQMYSDDGLYTLNGPFQQSRTEVAGGQHALVLDPRISHSPAVVFENVIKGDYFTLSIKRSRSDHSDHGFLTAEYQDADSSLIRFRENQSISSIHSDWELVRLHFTVSSQPVDSTLVCYYTWQGEGHQFIDDVKAVHNSQ